MKNVERLFYILHTSENISYWCRQLSHRCEKNALFLQVICPIATLPQQLHRTSTHYKTNEAFFYLTFFTLCTYFFLEHYLSLSYFFKSSTMYILMLVNSHFNNSCKKASQYILQIQSQRTRATLLLINMKGLIRLDKYHASRRHFASGGRNAKFGTFPEMVFLLPDTLLSLVLIFQKSYFVNIKDYRLSSINI